ncbi:hypothetical protein BZA05DRAFT_414479 [Tricharina praecox]|uniref:uncharacterized protein n=1 Tax=Tricharina praecox TaxID=43433 RepID=UPI0022209B4A|nr:uncharacterized protein BZA05DRAFT_414479 [Tricharina praecox]KAI5858712.1 hypothetical protein BZA05DRAFT_414479 [Tricharina praecox]
MRAPNTNTTSEQLLRIYAAASWLRRVYEAAVAAAAAGMLDIASTAARILAGLRAAGAAAIGVYGKSARYLRKTVGALGSVAGKTWELAGTGVCAAGAALKRIDAKAWEVGECMLLPVVRRTADLLQCVASRAAEGCREIAGKISEASRAITTQALATSRSITGAAASKSESLAARMREHWRQHVKPRIIAAILELGIRSGGVVKRVKLVCSRTNTLFRAELRLLLGMVPPLRARASALATALAVKTQPACTSLVFAVKKVVLRMRLRLGAPASRQQQRGSTYSLYMNFITSKRLESPAVRIFICSSREERSSDVW